jgi:hypothetical protein
MKEPLYRWVCTFCGISDEAASPELARLSIDDHVQVAHPSARQAAAASDPDGERPEAGPEPRR